MMMEASSTSETSVNFHQTTRRNNPEDSHLHTRRREDKKSNKEKLRDARIGLRVSVPRSSLKSTVLGRPRTQFQVERNGLEQAFWLPNDSFTLLMQN
jgi:hypothetical protein